MKMDKSKGTIIKMLEKYFTANKDVILAFLFGSLSKAHYGALSDIDVAVYLKEGANEIRIWCEVERLLKQDVDLLVLNRASPIIAWEAIRGYPLVIKDRKLHLDLILELSEQAMDLIDRHIDMWKLKEEIKCMS